MAREKGLLIQLAKDGRASKLLCDCLSLDEVVSLDGALVAVDKTLYDCVFVDFGDLKILPFESLSSLVEDLNNRSIPVMCLSDQDSLANKLKAYEVGCDDYLSYSLNAEEMCARINKSLFNHIANRQLQSRLEDASSTAFSVMSDNSDLGANQRFLLGVNDCSSLDELGMLLFSILEHYGLSCSLQMRSQYGIKNMEANGMARDLESQLLLQMKDGGRYIDFGRRSILNYGTTSLLVRNMPVDDERKYGSIKDNTFALVQGVNARVMALDEHHHLEDEKEQLKKLSEDVKEVMQAIDESYQEVMREIVTAVEDMSSAISAKIPVLALSEEQEHFFESTTEVCVTTTNEIFNRGLKVDECFYRLKEDMDDAIARLNDSEEVFAQVLQEKPPEESDGVELF